MAFAKLGQRLDALQGSTELRRAVLVAVADLDLASIAPIALVLSIHYQSLHDEPFAAGSNDQLIASLRLSSIRHQEKT
jgi:hypothetical protein